LRGKLILGVILFRLEGRWKICRRVARLNEVSPVRSQCPFFGGGIAPAFRGAEGGILDLSKAKFMGRHWTGLDPIQPIEIQQNIVIWNRRGGINDGGARRVRCDQRGDRDAEEYPFHNSSLF